MTELTTLAVVLVNLVTVISCHERGVDEYSFSTFDSGEDFEGAKEKCKNNGSRLTFVSDDNMQRKLSEFLNASRIRSKVYIDIKLSQEALDTWYTTDGSRYYGRIVEQEPRDEDYKLYCCIKYLESQPYVSASRPDQYRNYICEFNGTKCFENGTLSYKDRCFVKYEDRNLTWLEARRYCISKGGDLARFTYPSEMFPESPPFNTSWLNTLLSYWVGIRWKNWSWVSPSDSGNEATYYAWSNGKPKNITFQCVCIDPEGNPPWSWTECSCKEQRSFICHLQEFATTATATVTKNEHSTLATSAPETTITKVATTATTTTSKNNDSTLTTTTTATITKFPTSAVIGLGVGLAAAAFVLVIIIITVIFAIFIRARKN